MNILNIVDINIFQIDCYMYKAMNNLLPTHFSNYFVKSDVLHDHHTMHIDNLHVISHCTQARDICTHVRGVTIWKSIEIAI